MVISSKSLDEDLGEMEDLEEIEDLDDLEETKGEDDEFSGDEDEDDDDEEIFWVNMNRVWYKYLLH